MDANNPGSGAQATPAAVPAAKPQGKFYRIAWGVAGVIFLILGVTQLYGVVKSYFVLPDCDSQQAKDTLSGIFKEHKFEPVRYESIKTVSSDKNQVVCNAVLPLPDGANLIADYSFFWEGSTAKIKYSMHRKAP